MEKNQLKTEYFKQKEILDEIRDEITLRRWEVLSKTYKMGKRIWGNKFSRMQLADDMDIPRTTVLRCLALDRANQKTWDLIKQKKISAFKVAMICQLKSVTYQDEIVEMVIQQKLSTVQIKSLKINNLNDVQKEKHRLAIEEGYSRLSSAYYNFDNWIVRGKMFLMMDTKHLPEDKVPEIKLKLKSLNQQLNGYVEKLEQVKAVKGDKVKFDDLKQGDIIMNSKKRPGRIPRQWKIVKIDEKHLQAVLEGDDRPGRRSNLISRDGYMKNWNVCE